MDALIDMEQRAYESLWQWTHYMTLTFDPSHDPDVGLSMSTFKTAVL